MSSKYLTLRALEGLAPVPAFVCIDENDFPHLWMNYAAVSDSISSIVAAINLTAAAFLDRHLGELEQVEALVWSDDADAFLQRRLAAAGLADPQQALAVRSSSHVEDAQGHSFAGLFATHLNVRGASALRDAIADVWRSNFSRPTLLERLRLGLLGAPGGMTVILQHMIQPLWAGVAFSHDPVSGEEGLLIEATAGLGEQLVSGADGGVQAREVNGAMVADAELSEQHGMLREVKALMALACAHLGDAADIEWAYDGSRTWLLQARPITTLTREAVNLAPVFEQVDLYLADNPSLERFKPLPDFAQYFRSKRKPLADFAASAGVPAGTSLLIRANSSGLEHGAALNAMLERFTQPTQVLDFSRHLRQQMLASGELAGRLRELLREGTSTFVIRDFVRGEAGMISHIIEDGGAVKVLVELSTDGLLAINRGTADTTTLVIDGDSAAGALHPLLNKEHLNTLWRATRQAVEQFGRVQLEWVVAAGKLCLIDYSAISGGAGNAPVGGGRIISAGYANGKTVVVEASQGLEELSIAASVSLTNIPTPRELGPVIEQIFDRIRASNAPVIILSPRPYAALASLVPYAAGFIFEQSSTLCHLAILLREHGVPALGSRALYQHALTQPHAVVDTSSV